MEYPLEQLAIIKQKKLEEAEKKLNEKKQLLIQEQEKLAAVEQERDKVKEHKMDKLTQLRATLDEGSTSDKIQQMKQYLKIVDEQLKQKESKVRDQVKVVTAAEQQVELARQEMMKKQQDVEKLKIHRKEWQQEMKLIEEQKEGNETDEMGSVLHSLKKRQKKRDSKET